MMSPLIVIVGETAAGKTALALALAAQFNGEIIAADSRTVYRGMDIGTAKPTVAEQARVAHHLLDVVNPDQTFTAADFQRLAQAAIADITARGKLPIMVGGSGLYIDGLLYDYDFRPLADPAERQRFQQLSIIELQAEIRARGLPMPANALNPRHLTRTLETGQAPPLKRGLRPNSLILGLQLPPAILQQRIADRVDAMFAAGLVAETEQLFASYGLTVPALETPGYTPLRQYLAGELSLAETKAQFIKNDLALAKRQRTWFKRNKSIHWLPQQSAQADAVELTTTFLNTLSSQS